MSAPVITKRVMLAALALRIGTNAHAVVVRQPGTLEQRIESDLFWSKFAAPRRVMVPPTGSLVQLADYRAKRRG